MSFEGYHQVLCERGHYSEFPLEGEDGRCPICKGCIVWTNLVDCTNGGSHGRVSLEYKYEGRTVTQVDSRGRYFTTIYHDVFKIPGAGDDSD